MHEDARKRAIHYLLPTLTLEERINLRAANPFIYARIAHVPTFYLLLQGFILATQLNVRPTSLEIVINISQRVKLSYKIILSSISIHFYISSHDIHVTSTSSLYSSRNDLIIIQSFT